MIGLSANVKEHAPPLAGAHVVTGVEVHDTGDVDDKAASSGCCGSSVSASWICVKGDRIEVDSVTCHS